MVGVKHPAHCGKVDVSSRGCTELQFSQMGYYYITGTAPPSTTIDQESTKLRLGLQATHTCDDRNNLCYPDLEHSVIEVRLKCQYLSSGLFTNSEHGPIS